MGTIMGKKKGEKGKGEKREKRKGGRIGGIGEERGEKINSHIFSSSSLSSPTRTP